MSIFWGFGPESPVLGVWAQKHVSGHKMDKNNENPLDSIRQNKNVPQQAGVLNGEQPVKKNEKDSMWDGIVKAGSRSNVL